MQIVVANALTSVAILAFLCAWGIFAVIVIATRFAFDLLLRLPKVLWYTALAPIPFGLSMWKFTQNEPPEQRWPALVVAPICTLLHVIGWSLFFGGVL